MAAWRLVGKIWCPTVLCLGVAVIVLAGSAFGNEDFSVTLSEMLIRMTVCVAMYMFIGNSGILSFGHIGFMCLGAYFAAWAACDPMWKQMMLSGLPAFLKEEQYPFLVAVTGGGVTAAVAALAFGAVIMRLSGIAASIATFAFLVIVNSVYSNWDSVTAGTSSIIGVPTIVTPWVAFAFAAVTIFAAWLFQNSRFGLMLRASRDDEVAAQASGIRIATMRLCAFVLSAFFVGTGGGLYAHFLGILTVDVFFIQLSFVTLAMLVVGGIGSLSGAVVGVVVVTSAVEILRAGESGVDLSGSHLHLPLGSQEIGLGIVMALVLAFRSSGLTRGREVRLPPRLRVSAGRTRTHTVMVAVTEERR